MGCGVRVASGPEGCGWAGQTRGAKAFPKGTRGWNVQAHHLLSLLWELWN